MSMIESTRLPYNAHFTRRQRQADSVAIFTHMMLLFKLATSNIHAAMITHFLKNFEVRLFGLAGQNILLGNFFKVSLEYIFMKNYKNMGTIKGLCVTLTRTLLNLLKVQFLGISDCSAPSLPPPYK